MRLKFDFWRMHPHNGWTLPRIVHHLSHVALGLPLALVAKVVLQVAQRFGYSPDAFAAVLVAALALLIACADKCLWLSWGERLHTTLHWGRFGMGNTLDFVSDALLTELGAFVYVWAFDGWRGWLGGAGALLLLGTFNGE